MQLLGKQVDMAWGDFLRLPVFLAPLLLLALTGTWWGISPLKPILGHVWAPLLLAAVVQFLFCYPVYVRVGAKLLRFEVDGDLLLAVGASAALALSLWRFRHLTPAAGAEQMLPVWRDAAFGASLLSVAMLGDMILRNANRTQPMPIRHGPAGRVIVAPGDLIPADGVVTDGLSEIQDPVGSDDVFPTIVRPGTHVHLGARNGDGTLTIELHEDGQPRRKIGKRAALQDRLATMLAWVAGAVLAGILLAIAWRLWLAGSVTDPIMTGLQMLSLAAPLGLGLVVAAPSSEVITAARRLGIEIRDLAVLDRLRQAGAVVIGHRGVLVPDRLRMISVHCIEGLAAPDLIRRAASVAQAGHDPWGVAILDFAVGYRMRLKPAASYRCTIGEGMSAHTENREILVGCREYLQAHGIDCKPLDEAAENVLKQGRRLRWVAEIAATRQAIGLIVFGAPSVNGAVEAVKNLKRLGLETAWLARRDDPAHLALAKHLKIGRVVSEKPEEASAQLVQLRKESGPLLVVSADVLPEDLSSQDVFLPFGRRMMEQVPSAAVAITRHDPRVIVDLLLLAARHRQMVLTNAIIAYAAALLLALAPFWLGPRSDLGSYEVGVVLILALSSLSLRAMPTTANEVDEE
jgi:Cu+-exporting ATPase